MSLQPTNLQSAALASLTDVLISDNWIIAGSCKFVKRFASIDPACHKSMYISLTVSLEVNLPRQLLITFQTRMMEYLRLRLSSICVWP
jgi:hypothetical protein